MTSVRSSTAFIDNTVQVRSRSIGGKVSGAKKEEPVGAAGRRNGWATTTATPPVPPVPHHPPPCRPCRPGGGGGATPCCVPPPPPAKIENNDTLQYKRWLGRRARPYPKLRDFIARCRPIAICKAYNSLQACYHHHQQQAWFWWWWLLCGEYGHCS